MTLRERVQWIFRMALIMFVLASVAFLSALTAMRFAIQGREVTMPDVVGKLAVEAQQILQGRGVGFRVEDRIYNPAPVDSVVRQSPPPGTRVKVGQYAHLVLSLGPQKVTIPPLQEKNVRAARIALLRSGMQVGEVTSVYLLGWPPDTIVRQEPMPGTTDVTSPHVDLLVSMGPRPAAYVMPELTGLSLRDAEGKLSSGGLKVGKLTFVPVPGTLHGTVTVQSPPRGVRVDSASSIELQVAQ